MKVIANIYYEWQGASHTNPFSSKKNESQIKDALTAIPNQLSHSLLSDAFIGVSSNMEDNSITVEIATRNDKDRVKAVSTLTRILQEWDMRAEIKEEK